MRPRRRLPDNGAASALRAAVVVVEWEKRATLNDATSGGRVVVVVSGSGETGNDEAVWGAARGSRGTGDGRE